MTVAMTRFLPLVLAVGLLLPAAASARELGPWRLGMTREEVRSVSEYGPYREVGSTGGLETAHGELLGETVNVSFVFGESGCRLIQVWAYEGTDEEEAVRGFFRVYDYLVDRFGEVRGDGGPWPADLALEQLRERIPAPFFDHSEELSIEEIRARGKIEMEAHKLHIHPRVEPEGARIYGSLIKNPRLEHYWVFLYVRAP